ncbi:MAG TPA: hypothetical protein VIK31_01065, partial [Propionibacteriaceae bacterium]
RIEQVGDEVPLVIGEVDDRAHVGQHRTVMCQLSWHGWVDSCEGIRLQALSNWAQTMPWYSGQGHPIGG